MSSRARIAVLLVVLAVVAMWASARIRARRARLRWDATVRVAVLVLGDAPPGAADALRGALDGVARVLAEERNRYGVGPAPLAFEVVGPLHPARLPPTAPPGAGLARVAHALDLWRASRSAHSAAPRFRPGAYDVRIYVVAQPAAPGEVTFAEGLAEAGGEVGVVRAALDAGEPLLPAFAVAHEVLHCLGALDKYDEAGHARAPEGLADPGQSPRYPQLRAEIMAGEVALAPREGRLPAGVDEISVGPVTAAEIGWAAGAGASAGAPVGAPR